EIETKRNMKLDGLNKIQNNKINPENLISRTNSAFLNYLQNREITDDTFRSSNGNFYFPTEYFVQRAAVTAAGDSNALSSTHTLAPSVIEKQLIFDKLGAPAIQFVSGGGFKAPYLASSPATYNGEDSANADITWDSN